MPDCCAVGESREPRAVPKFNDGKSTCEFPNRRTTAYHRAQNHEATLLPIYFLVSTPRHCKAKSKKPIQPASISVVLYMVGKPGSKREARKQSSKAIIKSNRLATEVLDAKPPATACHNDPRDEKPC